MQILGSIDGVNYQHEYMVADSFISLTFRPQVMLQPFEYDPQERNKHKFMVQSVYAPEGPINHDVLWKVQLLSHCAAFTL